MRGADSASTSPTSPAVPFWWGQPSVHAAATGRTGSTWRGRALASASHLGRAASLGSRAEASPAASPFPGPQLCWREGGRSGCGGCVCAWVLPRVSSACTRVCSLARACGISPLHAGSIAHSLTLEDLCLGRRESAWDPSLLGGPQPLRPCTGAQMGSAGPHSRR